MSNEGALANLDVEAALDEIAAGTLSKQIAARYNVTPRGLRYKLAKHPNYKQAIAEQAHSIVEQAMDDIMTVGADEALPIARARARVDAAFKYAAAHNPNYASKQQVTSVTVNVDIALGFDAGSLLDNVRTFDNDVVQSSKQTKRLKKIDQGQDGDA